MLILENKEQCTGCGACYNICPQKCISMKEDNEGFLYPNIDTDYCIHCSMCNLVCPVYSGTTEELSCLPETYLAWANDEKLREQATSGGLFSAIASLMLEAGAVVFGAAYSEDNVVHHIKVDSVEKLSLINRSKYVQSNTEDTFQNVLSELAHGRQVLYSGTGCQIYGLLSYLKKKRTNVENLYTMDVICHGTPSPKLMREYLKWHKENADSEVVSIAMREKEHPRPYFSVPVTTAKYKNGKEYKKPAGNDYYGRFFWGEISSRPSCYECVFKTIGRISDITIGDCWFSRALTGKNNVPFDVTLCLVQTKKGKKLLTESKNLTALKVDEERAIKCNGGMIYSSASPHAKREEFFSRLGKESLNVLAEEYFPVKLHNKHSSVDSLKEKIKMIPGVYEYYFFKQKKKEFKSRCQRAIPKNAYKIRRI